MRKKIQDIRPGQDRVRIGIAENPKEPGEITNLFEEVIYIEDAGRFFRVYTEHDDFFVSENGEIEVEEG